MPARSCLPAPAGDTPAELVNRWGQATLDHYMQLYFSQEAAGAGECSTSLQMRQGRVGGRALVGPARCYARAWVDLFPTGVKSVLD